MPRFGKFLTGSGQGQEIETAGDSFWGLIEIADVLALPGLKPWAKFFSPSSGAIKQ
jgi:hypothetical protein